MKVTTRDVKDAILNSDVDRAVEILEAFGFTEGDDPCLFDNHGRTLAADMLGFAAAMSCDLNAALADRIIEYVSAAVNTPVFSQLVALYAGLEADDFGIIPEEIYAALCEANYTNEIADAIEDLDDETFEALLVFLADEPVNSTETKFSLPIVRRIYADEIIPAGAMFAFMGLCLYATLEEFLEDKGAKGIIWGVPVVFSPDLFADEPCDDEECDGEPCYPWCGHDEDDTE